MEEQRVGRRGHVAERVQPGLEGLDQVALVLTVVLDQAGKGARGAVAPGGDQVAELEDQRLDLDVLQPGDPALTAALAQHAQGPVRPRSSERQVGQVGRHRANPDDRSQAVPDSVEEVVGDAYRRAPHRPTPDPASGTRP